MNMWCVKMRIGFAVAGACQEVLRMCGMSGGGEIFTSCVAQTKPSEKPHWGVKSKN